MKAAIIGAGSTYTPELIEGFIERHTSLPFTEFYLMDIDKEKLDIVGNLAKRMFEAAGYPCKVVLTEDLDESLTGAAYVFAQIRVGRLPARILDEKIPLKYGLLGQETTGIGGFLNGLRTVPVVLDIAKRMERLALDAWLINFSNPSGIVAEAVQNYSSTKMAGLCNCPINMTADIAKAIERTDFEYDYLGLNHLSWITSVRVDGEERIQDLLNVSAGQMTNIPTVDYDDLLRKAIPAIPSGYLSYFYLRQQQVEKCRKEEKTRGEVCQELEEALLEQYQNKDLTVKPEELSRRGGALYSTAAVSLVDAIENDKQEYHVIDVKNNGAIPFMADDDVVEVKCLVGKSGFKPVKTEKNVHPYIEGIMQAVKAYEKLTVKAALSGKREDAMAALMVHPLIGDFDKAKAALEEMLDANAEFLPNFSEKR